jgi:cancer susceptibility candidate protein 1
MGKKKKKSKEELEQERLEREEAERIAREEAERLAEEERVRKAEEHRLRQEFLLNSRNEELARIVQEEEENKIYVANVEDAIVKADQDQLDMESWDRFRSCLSRPDPLKEADVNTYIQTWLEDQEGDLKTVMRECTRAEEVCKEATIHLARARAAGDEKKVAYFEEYMGLLRDAQLEKLDFASSYVINHAEDFANDKGGCQVSEKEGELKIGLWVNLALKPFRLKVVDYYNCGMVTDIPKPCSLIGVAIRTLYLPFTHIKGMGASSSGEVPIGGVLHLDMLKLPKRTRKVKEWEMSRISNLTTGVERLHYPPGASPHDHAASTNAQPFRVKVTLPSTLVVPSDPVVAYWNGEDKTWSSEGIAEVNFDAPSRLLSFHTTKLTPIAVIQPNHIDLPFERWSITPTGQNRADAVFEAKRFMVTISIDGGMCTLTGPKQPELETLIGSPMEPGSLFTELALRGINLCPKDENAPNCFQEGSPEACIVPKDAHLETQALNDVSTIAGAFGVASSVWNQQRGSERIVFRIIEKCATFDQEDMHPPSPRGSEGGSQPNSPRGKEEEEWNTVCYELDAPTPELETVVAEPVLQNKVRCTVLGVSESDSEWSSQADAGAVSHAYLKYCLSGKCTPEAEDVMRETSPAFISTVRSMLRLSRVFSFS